MSYHGNIITSTYNNVKIDLLKSCLKVPKQANCARPSGFDTQILSCLVDGLRRLSGLLTSTETIYCLVKPSK